MSAIGWALIVLGLLIVGWIIVQASNSVPGMVGTQRTAAQGTGLTSTWQAYPPVPSAQQPATFKLSPFYTGRMFKV